MASMYAHMCTRMHINAKAEACRENICSCGREPCLQSMAKLLRMMHAIGTWHHVPCTRSIVKSRRHNLTLLRKLRNTQETSLWNYSNDQQDFWTKQKNGNTKLDPNSLYPLRVPSYKCRSIRFTLENWVTMPGTLWKYNHSQWSENSMLSMMQSRPLCELENEACYRPWTAGVCVSEIIHITLQRWTLKVMPHYSHCGINAHVSCIRWCTIFCYHFGTQFLCNTQAAMHHQEPILKRIVLCPSDKWSKICAKSSSSAYLPFMASSWSWWAMETVETCAFLNIASATTFCISSTCTIWKWTGIRSWPMCFSNNLTWLKKYRKNWWSVWTVK